MSVWKKHIAPRDCGYDEIKELSEFIGPNYITVLDYGCGYGRLTSSFTAKQYIGYDPEIPLINEARENNPRYIYTDMFPSGLRPELILAYTVFVHMSDEEITKVIGKLQPKSICIVEILGKHWRRKGGFPPVYNRDLADYHKLLPNYTLENNQAIVHKGYTVKQHKEIDMSYLLWTISDV